MVSKFKSWLFDQTQSEIAFLALRVLIGVNMILHGYPKITGGVAKWEWLGGTMANVGITFWPVLWGFLAAFAEFFGGIGLALGLLTKLSSAGLAFTMLIAALFHIMAGDPYVMKSSHSVELLFVCLFFMMSGGGKYSLDRIWFAKKDQ